MAITGQKYIEQHILSVCHFKPCDVYIPFFSSPRCNRLFQGINITGSIFVLSVYVFLGHNCVLRSLKFKYISYYGKKVEIMECKFLNKKDNKNLEVLTV